MTAPFSGMLALLENAAPARAVTAKNPAPAKTPSSHDWLDQIPDDFQFDRKYVESLLGVDKKGARNRVERAEYNPLIKLVGYRGKRGGKAYIYEKVKGKS